MARQDGVELGEVTEASFDGFRRAFAATFGFTPTTDDITRSREWAELDRLIAARDVTGQVVGTSGAYTFEVSLPGGRSAGCAGVSVVSVRADHRRRGLLSRMMTQLLDDAAARGEPFAALWASESPIYGRYGFGPAVPTLEVSIDTRHGALRAEGPVGDVRLIDVEAARSAFPPIYDRFRSTRAGVLSRSAAWWSRVLTHEPSPAPETGPLRLALLPDRGFLIYHLASDWTDGVPTATVTVHDLVALDPGALAVLLRFAIDTDLAERVELVRRAPDDPLLALLVDPARARVTAGWPLYVRLVDVPAALEARGYLGDGEMVLEVRDDGRPANAGRWCLTASGGAGRCRRTDAEPDVSLDVEVLATISLGGVRATSLHDAGLIDGSSATALRLDRLFAAERAPVCDQMF